MKQSLPSDPVGDRQAVQLPAAYVRLYTDEHGHSRFEDVTLEGDTRGVTESDLRATFSSLISADAVLFRRVVHEASDDQRHTSPRRQFIIHLSGECEVEACHGVKRRMGPGTVLLLEDIDGHGHITRRVGEKDRMTLVVHLPTSPVAVAETKKC